ncbi:hypothetical protein G6F42_007635 [Rhizopus arrhizus]|nr:hypothetical protein G6F42_007635 [Rhizopus arrhizus]
MSDLTKAIEAYIKRRKTKSTIQGFLNDDENNKELLSVWFEVYNKYEDTLKAFVAKFKQIYKAQVNKSYKNKAKLDLKSIFEESKSQNSAMANGRRVLNEATNVAAQRLILRLKRPSMTSFGAFLSTSLLSTPAAATSSAALSSSLLSTPAAPAPAPSITVALSSVEDKLNSYINECILEGKKHGFDLQTQIHDVLASKRIILLRKSQQCKKLIEQVDVDSLLKTTRSDALKTEIKVDVNIYLKLATLLRDLNETIDRRTTKVQLDQLYAEANEEDCVIIEIFSNLVQKQPNQERLSPICHRPDKNRFLVWLNRQDESTAVSKPDAIMMATPQKTSDVTLGYVEVKSDDSMSNPELAFVDLVRVGAFGRTLMLRKSNRKVIAAKCIGYNIVFYLVSEQDGITWPLTER